MRKNTLLNTVKSWYSDTLSADCGYGRNLHGVRCYFNNTEFKIFKLFQLKNKGFLWLC